MEAGTGKTKIAVEWLRSRQRNALVVVPKRIVKKWKEELGDVKATVVTKEQFKTMGIFQSPSALVLDEAHFASAPLFTKNRSQIAGKVYTFIKQNPDMPVLLLTATPISSTPANLHTLLCYIGHFIEWKKWRDHFYFLERKPYLPRPAYIPKSNWRILIQPVLLKYAHIALMKDCVDILPPVTEDIIKLETKSYPVTELTPMAQFVERHRNEQHEKSKIIREIGSEYRKVVVVAHFREQIDTLFKELSKDKHTYVLHGGIKDQEEVIKNAQEDDECYLVCQNSIGAGFDLNSFAVMIFASQSYSYTSFVQMKARIRRIHDLKPVRYIYLQAGKADRGVYNQLQKGEDFDITKFTDKDEK